MSSTQPSNVEATVGIAFYNAMPHFAVAVASVLRQTFANFELLLIDDGSTDDSLAFARSIRDPRVKVFSDGKNLKFNVRLNQLVDLARGTYFFRMDADDVMFPERLDAQLKILRAHREDVVVGSAAITIGVDGQIKGYRGAFKPPVSDYTARHQFIHPTVASTTDWFRRNRYSNSFLFHRSQDTELWVRTWRSTKFINITKPLLFYREGDEIPIENYFGTAFGLAFIGIRKGTLGGLIWAGVELLKAWMVAVLRHFYTTKLLTRRRNRGLPPEKVGYYSELLAMIRADVGK